METAHEAAVAHLKTLDRAEHPVLEEVLAVARMYPVEVQRACEDAVKRGEDSAILYPIKAIADRQAVELQALLDALTTPAPRRVALADEPLDPTQPAGPVSPTLPKNPGDPDPNLPPDGSSGFSGIGLSGDGRDVKSALFPHEVAVGTPDPALETQAARIAGDVAQLERDQAALDADKARITADSKV